LGVDIDKLRGAININQETLAKIVNLIKQVGIYESFKALMKQEFFRNAVKKKLSELYQALVDKYDIVAHNLRETTTEDRKCRLTVEITIPDRELRKEFVDRLRKTVKQVFESDFSLIPSLLREFEIEGVSCKEEGENVYVVVVGNEKLSEVVLNLKGGGELGKEGGESRKGG